MPGTAAFVVNRTRVRDWAQVSAHCRAVAAACGWAPLLLETAADDAGAGLTRRALAAGAGLVFAVGGDGTVRACAQALAGPRGQVGGAPGHRQPDRAGAGRSGGARGRSRDGLRPPRAPDRPRGRRW